MDMHLTDGSAWCSNCGWKTIGRNSMCNASRHYKKYHHLVHVEQRYEQGEVCMDKLNEAIIAPIIQGRLE